MRTFKKYKANHRNILSFTASIVVSVVGFVMTLPFLWFVAFAASSPYMSMFQFLSIIGIVIGAPMSVFGLVNLFTERSFGPSHSSSELDISRIRYTVETDKMNKH